MLTRDTNRLLRINETQKLRLKYYTKSTTMCRETCNIATLNFRDSVAILLYNETLRFHVCRLKYQNMNMRTELIIPFETNMSTERTHTKLLCIFYNRRLILRLQN